MATRLMPASLKAIWRCAKDWRVRTKAKPTTMPMAMIAARRRPMVHMRACLRRHVVRSQSASINLSRPAPPSYSAGCGASDGTRPALVSAGRHTSLLLSHQAFGIEADGQCADGRATGIDHSDTGLQLEALGRFILLDIVGEDSAGAGAGMLFWNLPSSPCQ